MHSWLHLQGGYPQAIKLISPPQLMVISLNGSEILSWVQGLMLPLNTETFQLFAVIALLSNVFQGNAHFP